MRMVCLLLRRTRKVKWSRLIVTGIFLSFFFYLYSSHNGAVGKKCDFNLNVNDSNCTVAAETVNAEPKIQTSTELPPFNEYSYPFIIPNVKKCMNVDGTTKEKVHLLLIVKSAAGNLKRRDIIRQTWGLENRFPDVVIRRVFNLGLLFTNDSLIQQQVMDEHFQNGDIVQSAFTDSYYNNTIKTMMGMKWAFENCPTTNFVMFVDDDMYVSVKNVIRFVNHPQDFPNFYENKTASDTVRLEESDITNGTTDFYAGFHMVNFSPHRDKNSKWYVSIDEYPYDKYPTFILAGAFIMSFPTLKKMYFASKRTKHLNFDDVYLGLVAANAGITPFHTRRFHNFEPPSDYQFAISTHMYGDTLKMKNLWNEQESLSNA